MSRILVVDDESGWRDLCCEKLAEMGHSCIATGDPGEVLPLVKSNRPDLLVLDMRIPVGGRLLLGAVGEEYPELPVVVHTVYGGYRQDPEIVKHARFAVKSPGLDELVREVRDVLSVTPEAAARSQGIAHRGAAGMESVPVDSGYRKGVLMDDRRKG
jgi:DNA-binding NtrC family response regulator